MRKAKWSLVMGCGLVGVALIPLTGDYWWVRYLDIGIAAHGGFWIGVWSND